MDHVNKFISIFVLSFKLSENGGSIGTSHIVGRGVKPGYTVPLQKMPPTVWFDSNIVVTKNPSPGLFL